MRFISYKEIKKQLIEIFRYSVASIILISTFICLFYATIYLNPIYHCYTKPQIEQYLNETSEYILQNSDNATEIVQNIILWENSIGLTTFNKWYLKPLRFSKDPKWNIYIGKANCGEKAIIFEDMAKRTNLTYRRIQIDGFIDTKNNTNNHRWSEVWFDGDWRISDSGFNLWYPKNNQSYFTSNKGFLIGHVSIFNDNLTFEDCTDSYVNNTGKLIIQVLRDEESVADARVSIKLNNHNTSCYTIGKTIKYFTNESGLCEVTLGVYNETYYTVDATHVGMFKYTGKENVTITDGTTHLTVELDELKIL